MQIVYILWLRQLKRYLRSRARIIGSLGQPLLFLLALGFGFSPIYEKAGEGDYIQFLTAGVIAMSVMFTALFSGLEIIWDRQFGFLKETLVAPVSRFHIVSGRTLGGATVATLQGAIVLLVSLPAGFRPAEVNLLPFSFLFMFLIALLFTGLATVIASLLEDMQGYQLIMNFLVLPLFFLSGALFPLKDLPRPIEVAARIDPLTYGVDGLRGTLSGSSHFGLGSDLSVLCLVTLAILAAGSYFFSRIQI